MQIIHHPSHTRNMALVYGWTTLILLIVVIVVSFINRVAASIPLLFACLFGLQAFKELAPVAERWITGHIGEQRVLKILSELPDRYIAVTNFVVPGTQQGDIDLLLIGPMGILVVEVKTYSGVIVYENGRWWKRQPNGWKTRIKKNPSGQARNNRKALLNHLQQQRAQHPALKNLFIPVEPLLVFVGADELETGSLSMAALRVNSLPAYIRSLPAPLSDANTASTAALFQVDPLKSRVSASR